MSFFSKSLRGLLILTLSALGTAVIIALSTVPATQAGTTTAAPAPILVITSTASANKFGPYLGEILRAEGLSDYDTLDLAELTTTLPATYQVVVLAETTLNASQVNVISSYVAAGGHLIAMRPDQQLKSLFGLTTPITAAQTDGYLKLTAGPTSTAGLTPSALQVHVPTDHYTVAGGETLALFYTSPTTATLYPAVARGTSGRAVAFAFDLAQNVAYLRQGNPDLADRSDTTGFTTGKVISSWDAANPVVTRTIELFGSPNITTTAPWIDRDLIPVPQADEQMRLFARLVKEAVEAAHPLPQLWYFPGTAKTMLILTGDAHGNNLQQFTDEISGTGGINLNGGRITFFMSNSGDLYEYALSPTIQAPLQAWVSQGHTFGIHPYGAKFQQTLTTGITQALSSFNFSFIAVPQNVPAIPLSRAIRNHQVEWAGWTTAAELEAAYAFRLDTNFYHWGAWLQKADGTWPHGYLTGSGQPMKFIKADGTVLPIYQQLTQLVDEQLITNIAGDNHDGFEGLNGDQAFLVSQQLIDASQAGDYAALMTQFHVDYYANGDANLWADQTMAYAQILGIPRWSADDWLSFTEMRHDANYKDLVWDAATRTLTFTLDAAPTNLLNPTTPLSLTTLLPATYLGYGLTALTVDGSPAAAVPLTIKGQPLLAVPMLAGARTVVASYNSPLPGGTVVQTSVADFQPACTYTATNVYASDLNGAGGALMLNGTPISDAFSGSTLNPIWNAGNYGGATPALNNTGILTVGAHSWVSSTTTLLHGAVEFGASFGTTITQHIGLASPNFQGAYVFMSTSNKDGIYDGSLHGRLRVPANGGGYTEQDIALGSIPAGFHRYRIEWVVFNGIDRATFYVDGSGAAAPAGNLIDSPSTVLITDTMHTVFSNDGPGSLAVDWVQTTPPYAAAGRYTSCVLDAGPNFAWTNLQWSAALAAGTLITAEARTSFDGAAWSAWTPVTSGAAFSQPRRYGQYQLYLSTSNPQASPVVNDVSLLYGAQTLTVTKSAGGLNPAIGQTFPFTLSISVPDTTTYGLKITDTLPAGYLFTTAGMTITGLSPAPALTANPSGPNDGTQPVVVTWNIGNVLATTETVRLVYSATVANVVTNTRGVTLTNTAQLANNNSFGATQAPLSAADSSTLQEPALAITKTLLTPAGQNYPGGRSIYQIVVRHPGGVNVSPAYDVLVTDTLPAALTLAAAPTITPSAGVNAGNASVGNILGVTATVLAAGQAVTVTYPVTVSAAQADGAVIANTAVVTWTSQPGVVTDERTSYLTQSSASLLVQTPALSLTAGASADSLQPGHLLTYTFVVSNASPVPASGVALTATLPAELSLKSASPGGAPNWHGLSVAGYGTQTVTATVQLTTPVAAGYTQFVVTTTVGDDQAHGQEAVTVDNTAVVTTSVIAAPDMGITATSLSPVTPGSTLTYTLTYSNAGDQGATGVILTATVPANTSYAGGAAWSLVAGQTYTQTHQPGGSLNGGGAAGTTTFTVTVATPLTAGTHTLAFTATVGEDGTNGTGPNLVSNTAVFTTGLTTHPYLNVAFNAAPAAVTPDGIYIYTLGYTNTGDIGATGVTLTATVPANARYTGGAVWACLTGIGAGQACTFQPGGTLASGTSGTVNFTVTVTNPVPAGVGTFTQTVSIGDDGTNGTNANSTPSASSVATLMAAPDLTIGANADAASVIPGTPLTYTLYYTNTGNQGATNLTVTATVPANTKFTGTGWTGCTSGVSGAGSVCTQTFAPELAGNGGAGSPLTFAVAVTRPLSAGTASLVFTASVGDNGANGLEPSYANNSASVTTSVDGQPDLGLTVSGAPSPAVPGGVVTYTLTYSNAGGIGVIGTTITATVPANARYNAAASGGTSWSCTGSGGAGAQCLFSPGVELAGAGGANGSPVKFAVTITNPLPAGTRGITLTASLGDNGANGLDSAYGNNLASAGITLTTHPNLSVAFTAAPAAVTPDGIYTYTLGYTNTGDIGASGVTLTATVPANARYTGSTWTCASGTGAGQICTQNIGTLNGGGASSSLNFVVTVTNPVPAGVGTFTQTVGIHDDGANGTNANSTPSASSVATLTAAPDLTIGANAGAASVIPGTPLTYTLYYTNTGNQGATNLTVTATVPANTKFTGTGWTGCTSGVSGAGSVCTQTFAPELAGNGGAGGPLTFAVAVTRPLSAGTASLVFTASVGDNGANGLEPSYANNSASVTTSVDGQPDLGLTVSGAPDPAVPDGVVTYTLTYSNAGGIGVIGTTLTATVPANARYNAAASGGTSWSCTGSGGAGAQCLFSPGVELAGAGGANGSPVKFAVTITNPVLAGGLTLPLQAVIGDNGANGADINTANNTVTASVVINAAPSLHVTLSNGSLPGVPSSFPGEPITYTVYYTNTGDRGAQGVTLSTTVPVNTFFFAAGSPGWTCAGGQTVSGTVCTNTVNTVEGGGAAGSVPLVMLVDLNTPRGVKLITATVVISDNGVNGLNPLVTSTVTTTLDLKPNLAVAVAGPSTAVPGGIVSYTMSYTNTGSEDVSSFVLTMTVPAGTLFQPARSHPAWVCPALSAGAVCAWTSAAPLIGPNAGGTLTFTVGVTNPAAAGLDLFTAQAVISNTTGGAPERTLADNTAAKTTTLQAAPDLHVAVGGVTETAPAAAGLAPTALSLPVGGGLVYTVVFSNTGNQDAAGVVLTATVPANAVYAPANSTGNWQCPHNGTAGAACTLAVGGLAGGAQGGSFLFAVASVNPVSAGGAGLDFAVSIGDDGRNGGAVGGGTTTANLSVAFTNAVADLALTLPGGNLTVTVGGGVVYDLRYANQGNRGTTNVVLTATLPAGLTYDAAASSAGWTCVGGACTYVLGSVAGGISGTVQLGVQTAGAPAPAQLPFSVQVGDDGLNGDANPNNNLAAQVTVILPGTRYLYLPAVLK